MSFSICSQIVTGSPETANADSLRLQFATLKNPGRGAHRKYLPNAFTEHGVIMAATVLNSPRAVEMSVYVTRAFVQMRSMLGTQKEILSRQRK